MTAPVAAWLPIAALLVGCTGYPDEDRPASPPSRMSQAERLAALNRLGRQPHLARHWRYELTPTCQLQVRSGRGNAWTTAVVPLVGSSLHNRYDDGRAHYEVRLRPPRPPGARQAVAEGRPAVPLADPTPVLQSGKWTDSVQARTLVAHLARGCGSEAEADAAE